MDRRRAVKELTVYDYGSQSAGNSKAYLVCSTMQLNQANRTTSANAKWHIWGHSGGVFRGKSELC